MCLQVECSRCHERHNAICAETGKNMSRENVDRRSCNTCPRDFFHLPVKSFIDLFTKIQIMFYQLRVGSFKPVAW